MDGGTWWAAVHGAARSWTRLSNFAFTFHFHALEKEIATHSSVLAWRIPGTGEPGGLPSMGSHRVRHDWSDLAAAAYLTLFDPMDSSPPAPLSMEYSRAESWSGYPFPYPGDLPKPGIELGSPELQADYCLSYWGSPISPYQFLKNVLMREELCALGKMILKEMVGWREIRVKAES